MENTLYNNIKNAIVKFYGDWAEESIIEVKTKTSIDGKTFYRYSMTTPKYMKTGIANVQEGKDIEILHDWGMVII